MFFSCLSEDVAKSFPHHHEKYVLIAILDRLRRMESTKENSCGDAKIVGSKAVKRGKKNVIEFGRNMLMENKRTQRLEST